MSDLITIRGLVYSKFKSIAAFAEAIGWSRQKATNIINGAQEPSLADVDKIAKALELGFDETAHFFLPSKSQVC